MVKKLFVLLMSVFMVLLSVPFIALAEDEAESTKPVINLTVGNELVGANGNNWQQSGTNLSYKGTGYTYYTDTSKPGNGRLVLDGTTLDSYYTFEYSDTEEGNLTYEAPGVISINFVKFNGGTRPKKVSELDIVVENPTQLTVKNHGENARTSYYRNDDFSRCFGVYAYGRDGDTDIPSTITITGAELSITADEKLIGESIGGIFAKTLAIGNDDVGGNVSINGLEAESANREGRWTVRLIGINALEELSIGKSSYVKISDLTSSADKYASIEGIEGPGAYIAEDATVEIGNLTATAHAGGSLDSIYALGMIMFDDLENHGTINIGQNDSKILMNFSNDFQGEQITFSTGAEGIRCDACELLNYGEIYADNVVTNFCTNSMGDLEDRMEVYADGIYAQFGISNFSEAVMYSNLKDGMELNIKAPNSDNGGFFAHGIATGGGSLLLAENADIFGRAGKMDITAANGSGASALGIYCPEIEATDSLVKGMANVADVKTSGQENTNDTPTGIYSHNDVMSNGVRNNQIAIVCGELEAKGNSDIIGDSRGSNSKERGDGIEILDAWSLNDNAVIEGFGARNNAITTGGRTFMPTLGEDYSPKLEYGSDENNTKTVYSLEGEEYANNAYAKISNKNTSHALGRDKEASKSDLVVNAAEVKAPVTGISHSNHTAPFVLLIVAVAVAIFLGGRRLAHK